MAYTAYRTWTTGEIVTAALMNEQVRDNGLLTAPAIMTGAGDLIYSSAANTPVRLPKDTNSTRSLTNTGTSNIPAWAQVALATGVSGTLPVANGGTNLTSLGTGVATFMGTPSSANLRGALTDETGTGAAVFATSPTLVTPALGTPASGVMTNVSGTASSLTAGNVTTNANLTGVVTSSGNATSIADKAIGTAKLADGTDGELITWDSSGVIAAVAVGTSTHVLTSNGAGAAPTFQAAAGGGPSPGVVKFHVHFDQGGSHTIQGTAYNVTSITDIGAGETRVNIATDFANATWTPVAMVGGNYHISNALSQDIAAGTINVNISNSSHAAADAGQNGVAGLGTQV